MNLPPDLFPQVRTQPSSFLSTSLLLLLRFRVRFRQGKKKGKKGVAFLTFFLPFHQSSYLDVVMPKKSCRFFLLPTKLPRYTVVLPLRQPGGDCLSATQQHPPTPPSVRSSIPFAAFFVRQHFPLCFHHLPPSPPVYRGAQQNRHTLSNHLTKILKAISRLCDFFAIFGWGGNPKKVHILEAYTPPKL